MFLLKSPPVVLTQKKKKVIMGLSCLKIFLLGSFCDHWFFFFFLVGGLSFTFPNAQWVLLDFSVTCRLDGREKVKMVLVWSGAIGQQVFRENV